MTQKEHYAAGRSVQYALFLFVLALIVSVMVLLIIYSPERFIEMIGVENSYIVLFFLGLLGGVSSLTATSFLVTASGFALGGLNPFVIGVVSGVGMTLGDLLFFLLGKKGRDVSKGVLRIKLEKVSEWISQKPPWLIFVVVFTYLAFTPFPGDILIVSLALFGVPLKLLIVPFLLGNIVLITLVTYLSVLGFGILG